MARRKVPRDADGLPLPKLRVTYRCRACGVKFKADQYEGDPDAACPNLECSAVQTPVGFDPGGGRAPSIGGNPRTKAFDAATQIVMEDHKMTDLADAPRAGDTMVAKLPIAQQRVADSMFDAKVRQEVMGAGQQGNPMAQALNRMARQGVAGGSSLNAGLSMVQPSSDYRDPIEPIHRAKTKPAVNIVNRV